MGRSAVARPSSVGSWGLSTMPGGVPKASAATSVASDGSLSGSCTTEIHQPAHWNRVGSAIGTRPEPRSASQVRQAPRACGRSPAGRGSWVTGTSVTEARQAAKPRVSAPAEGAVGSSGSITGASRRSCPDGPARVGGDPRRWHPGRWHRERGRRGGGAGGGGIGGGGMEGGGRGGGGGAAPRVLDVLAPRAEAQRAGGEVVLGGHLRPPLDRGLHPADAGGVRDDPDACADRVGGVG